MVEAGSACNRVAGPRGGFWLPLAGGGEVLVIASDELLQRVELPATTVWAPPPPPTSSLACLGNGGFMWMEED
jgi:hypothetical protein